MNSIPFRSEYLILLCKPEWWPPYSTSGRISANSGCFYMFRLILAEIEDSAGMSFELFFPWIWCLNWITPFPYIYIYIYLFYYDCLRFSLKHWRKKIQNDIVATRKTKKRKIRRTRWETEKERMHWCDGVQLFETLKRILKSVRDNWNKLDRWERLVHVGGFGKWESEFQEGSLSLITQNVGFIYKNAKNDFFIYL